jgi:hypothetical protein
LTAALSQNEPDRLNAPHRYGILDAAPKADFDRIAEMAAIFFRVSIAIVSVVDNDRPWFKSQRAIDTGQVEPARGVGCVRDFLDGDLPPAQRGSYGGWPAPTRTAAGTLARASNRG